MITLVPLAGSVHAGLRLADAAKPTAPTWQLTVAALVGITVIVVLIVWAKLHPFLALVIGSGVMALVAGTNLVNAFDSFTVGLGTTVGGVGVLIALGAIIGKMLIDSGGADQIVDTILARTPTQRVPWALAFIAFIVGIPLFFEVGVVLLIPVVMLVARRARLSPILVGIPALAGLSALHGLVPPHPGPLLAISSLKADLGITLGLGLLVAIPTVIIAGPLLAQVLVRWVHLDPPTTVLGVGEDRLDAQVRPVGVVQRTEPDDGGGATPGQQPLRQTAVVEAGQPAVETAPDQRPRPSFAVSVGVVLMPVVLMLIRALVEITKQEKTGWGSAFEFLGEPLVALLLTSLVALFTFGYRVGRTRSQVSDLVGASFLPIAGILLIVGAGGGFKQTLVDSGVGDVIANGITSAHLNPLLAGWLVAVLIRVATGSATVATITAAGIMVPIAAGLSPTHTALMVLAIGAGSVFLSHVNDAGFWLVKEYFGMTVGQTFKTWSLMETVLSVVAGGLVIMLGLVI